MSELLIDRLKKSVGWTCKVFLKNGFRYEGKILGADETYLEILEPRGIKIILVEEIKDCDIYKIQGEVGE